MAQYHHLTVYKSAFDFLLKLTQATANFQKSYRYTLGEKLIKDTNEFIVLIYRANSAKTTFERVEVIKLLLEKLQTINISLRLCYELKNIPKGHYAQISEISQDIEKQLNGWFSHTDKLLKKVIVIK